jgi:alanine racemase
MHQVQKMSQAILREVGTEKRTEGVAGERPHRPAWIEIDLGKLKRNYELINRDKPHGVQMLSVVKDDAYGHGAARVARTAVESGTAFLALSSLDEGMALRQRGIMSPMLLLGERQEAELPWCIQHGLTCCVNDRAGVEKLGAAAARLDRRVPVHLKVNTGMNRYGVRWTEAARLVELIGATKSLSLEGIMSHFSMSDETDKTYANLQLSRFREVLAQLEAKGVRVKYRHLCNSGGFLDLPQAHFDMVRVGILQFGVYPSLVCRKLAGVESIMTVKARIAAIQHIEKGDCVGYSMRYEAPGPRRIAVIPVGYGDNFPRLRNTGCVLAAGKRAPLVGGVAMDAFMVDVTDIPEAGMWDEVVLMGRQGNDEISAREIGQWKNSTCYDILTGWRGRLPRIYLNEDEVV